MAKKSPEKTVEKTRPESGKKAGRKLNQEFKDQIIRDTDAAKAKGAAGGVRSGEVRRERAEKMKEAKAAARYVLELGARGGIKSNLVELGFEEDVQTNMGALYGRLFMMAMSGNLEAYRELMKAAGFDTEENRKERESINADRRREVELEAKVAALGSNPEGMSAAINMGDEDGRNDVVIYVPQMESIEDCTYHEPESEAEEEATEL